MGTVKVSSKGQIVIPKAIREAQGIAAGAEFIVTAEGGGLRLTPTPLFAPTTVAEVAGMLHKLGRKRLSEVDLKRRIRARLKTQDRATQGR